MELRVYSDLDLLGAEVLFNRPRSWWKQFKLSFSKDCTFYSTIPTLTYLKTESYCRYLRKEYDVYFTTSHLISVLYQDFMAKYERYNNIEWVYNFVNSVDRPSKLVIHNHLQNEVLEVDNEQQLTKKTLQVTLKKDAAILGEILLKELDDIYGQYMRLETLIEVIWERFIRDKHKVSVKKITKDLIDMIEGL